MDAPWSGEKVPLPAARKRLLLEALEVECSNLDALLLKKRQLVAQRAFEAARTAPHAQRPQPDLVPHFYKNSSYCAG